jgi:hypothetical protein
MSMRIRTPEEEALFRLVRGEPLGPALAACRGEELRRLACSHLVLAPLAARMEADEALDPGWRRWGASASLAAKSDARRCAEGRSRTIKLLETRGIDSIVLKGASLSLGRPRDEGDVGLLIPERSLLEAISTLEAAGYEYRGFERNMHIKAREYRDWEKLSSWSVQFEFSEPSSGTLVELHIALFDTDRVYAEDFSGLRAAIGEIFSAYVVDRETGLRFLALEDRALLLAIHAGAKRSPANRSFVLRHLLDLEALIDAGLDWTALERRAFRFGAAHHLLLLLRLYEWIAGPRAPIGLADALEEKLPKSLARIVRLHLRCIVDLRGYSRPAAFAYLIVSPFVLRSSRNSRLKALLVLPILFPNPFSLADIYGLPRRSKWVYPLYALEPLRYASRIMRKALRSLGSMWAARRANRALYGPNSRPSSRRGGSWED